MLYAKLDADGTLVIQANEPIEAYALTQWEKQRAAGRAKLKVETGTLFSIDELVKSLGKDIKEFREWKEKCQTGAMLTNEDADKILGPWGHLVKK